MSTASQVTSGLPRWNAPADDENTPHSGDIAINDVESLKKGIIKTSRNKTKVSYNILLVGGAGVGKSSAVEFIANVLAGNDIDNYNLDILNHNNEQGGPGNQSQTNSARLYEFRSNNGIAVRILDTPGLTNTRGIQQSKLYMKNIATQFKKHINSTTAVLVLANGTVPRSTVGITNALSTLSSVFSNTLGHNIAFMFTNVSNHFSWNFRQETVPKVFKCAPQFKIDNPIALQKKYLAFKDDQRMNDRTKMLKEMHYGEENALETLVHLFDWLDGLERQPTTERHMRGSSEWVKGLLRNVEVQVQERVRKVKGILIGE